MLRFWQRLIFGVILWLGWFVPLSFVGAVEIPARPQGYVSDHANLLSGKTRNQLEEFLRSYEQKTTNQVVVVTLPTIGGEPLEEFSIRLAERWEVGQKGRDNGVIFLIIKEDHLLRIEVGYGLEGVLPDALAGQIIRQIVAPHFSQGRFEEGITAGVTAIVQATQGEFKAEAEPQKSAGDEQFSAFFIFLFIFAAALSIGDLIRYSAYFSGHRLYRNRYSFWEWWFRFAFLFFFFNFLYRAFFNTRLSSGRGYYGSRTGFGGFSSGGGGFSSGGGSFGGGGASGRW
jgi:uncharacterized protein